LQAKRLDNKQRGTASSVCALPGLWLDLDIEGSAHAQKNLPRSLEEAMGFVTDLPLAPTAIIHTGNGVHIWWAFAELWVFEDDDDGRRASELAKDWQGLLLKAAKVKGWKLDNTSDLARVLRLPGTLNHKGTEEGSDPQQVRVIEINDAIRYQPDQFMGAIEEEGAAGRGEEKTQDDDERADIKAILEGCSWLKHCRDDASELPEPEWVAALSIVGRCENGRTLAHEWSEPYPNYDRTETDKKLVAALEKAGPWTCEAIADKASGGEYCGTCPHKGRVRSPISLGTDYLAELIERHVYVAGTKRFYDLETGQFLDKEQLNDMWLHRHKGKSTPAYGALRSRDLIKVDNPTYLPGGELIVKEERERRLNLWYPNELEPDPNGDISPFANHIEYLIPDKMARDHVLDSLAFQVQRPGEKVSHAILIQGMEGTGKSFIGQAMKKVLGPHNVTAVDSNELRSDYTGWIKDTQLVIVEEMMALGRRDLMNKLKPMITQPYFRINEKYVVQYEIANRANFLLFTNYEDAILLDHGDRRYFVYHSPAKPRGAEYYDGLFQWLEDNAGVVLHWLSKRDLSGFNANARPPMTAAKEAVIEKSLPPLEMYLRDKFKAEEWPFLGDLSAPSHVWDALPAPLRANVNRVADVLKKLGGEKLGQKRVATGKPTIYAMRNKEQWRQASEAEIKKHYQDPSLKENRGDKGLF
jgi:hypothetical protein